MKNSFTSGEKSSLREVTTQRTDVPELFALLSDSGLSELQARLKAATSDGAPAELP